MELDEYAPLTFDFGDGPVPAHRHVNGSGWVADSAFVEASAQVSGNAQVYGDARVYGNARVYGDAWVSGDAWVYGDALVEHPRDFVVIGPLGSRDAYLTWTRSDNCIATGCFRGTAAQFLVAVAATHGDNEHARAYRAAAAFLETLNGG